MATYDINVVALSGRLGQAPELKYTPNGTAVANFSLAVGRGEETYWIAVVCWKQTAEWAANSLDKGSAVMVSGRLQTREWTAQDGTKRKAVEIVADNVRSLDKKERQDEADPYE
jgi:single-strand DNA-binding protein